MTDTDNQPTRSFRLLTRWNPPKPVLIALFALGAVCAAAVVVALGPTNPRAYVCAVFVFVSPILTAIDFAERRLPDVITLPAAAASVVALVASAVASGSWQSVLRGGSGMVILFAVFFVMFVVAGGAFGFGDVKLGLSMGAVLGAHSWMALLIGPMIGLIMAFVVGLALMLARKANLKSAIALGPYLIFGTIAVIVLGIL